MMIARCAIRASGKSSSASFFHAWMGKKPLKVLGTLLAVTLKASTYQSLTNLRKTSTLSTSHVFELSFEPARNTKR
jgi:hypothetical protein